MQRPPIFEASDDNEYVLKLDTADPSFAVAEVVAAVLAGALDVPIPDFALLDVPDVLTERRDRMVDTLVGLRERLG